MIKVLVVDDSSLIRRLVTMSLAGDPEIEVVGIAENGKDAIEAVERLKPDAVTLDIEMPVLDGLGALEGIRANHPRLPVIMFSTLTERGATKTLQALSMGASDYVTKPSNTGSVSESMAAVRDQLVPKIKALAGVQRLSRSRTTHSPSPRIATTGRPVAGAGVAGADVAGAGVAEAARRKPEVLLIGCSTGGPDALAHVMAQLPGTLPVPVLVVQHMPPVFTTMFAERLNRGSALTVAEASGGEALEAGTVYLAPGDHHLQVTETAGMVRTLLTQDQPENFCRPAVDVLFRSAADVFGGAAIAVVLTGMGSDGMLGCRILSDKGASVLVQDEDTSVVWGMPGAVATDGRADEILPLDDIAPRLVTMLA